MLEWSPDMDNNQAQYESLKVGDMVAFKDFRLHDEKFGIVIKIYKGILEYRPLVRVIDSKFQFIMLEEEFSHKLNHEEEFAVRMEH